MGKKPDYGASEDSPDACFGGLGRSYLGPWMIHEKSIPYNSTVPFTDGAVVTYEKRERPHIVWDANQNPAWLVTGAVTPSGQHGYNGKSLTLVQQIDTGSS